MLRFMDGFDHHSNNTMEDSGKWTNNLAWTVGSSDTHRRFAGFGQYMSTAFTATTVYKDIPTNEASGVFGLDIKLAPTGNYVICPFILSDGSTVQIAVVINSDRTLSILRSTSATVLGTSTYVLPTNQHVYLEFKWKISNSISTNDVILYADGVDILNLAATTDTQNTANAYINRFGFGFQSGLVSGTLPEAYVDDFYWLDLTGSVNNAPLGPVRVVTLSPTATGNSSQLVNNSGNSTNNYQRVDEIPPTTDTDYVETSTPGNKDTYGFGDLPASVSAIYGVAINTLAKKTDAAARTFKSQVRISSTDYENAEHTLTTGYINYQDIMETSPATSSPFTASEVNGAEFGTKCHA